MEIRPVTYVKVISADPKKTEDWFPLNGMIEAYGRYCRDMGIDHVKQVMFENFLNGER